MIFVSFDTRFLGNVVEAINNLTKTVSEKGDKIVSAFTDLQAEVVTLGTDLSTQLGNLNTSLQSELTAITNALGSVGTSDTDIQTVTDSLKSFGTSLDTGIQAVQASIDAETAKLAPIPPSPAA